MKALVFLPFALQAGLMALDEFHFHRRRGLPRWERWGHPLDTLTVLAAFVYLSWMPPSKASIGVFTGLAAFSCLFVTKDEFVHAGRCSGAEHWLHANLFLLHPVTFAAAAYLWWQRMFPGFLLTQTVLLAGFLLYQLTYWNFYARPLRE